MDWEQQIFRCFWETGGFPKKELVVRIEWKTHLLTLWQDSRWPTKDSLGPRTKPDGHKKQPVMALQFAFALCWTGYSSSTSLFRCFSVLFFLQLHQPVLPENRIGEYSTIHKYSFLPDKVCSPAEEEGKEGSSNSKWEGKTNSRGREIPVIQDIRQCSHVAKIVPNLATRGW